MNPVLVNNALNKIKYIEELTKNYESICKVEGAFNHYLEGNIKDDGLKALDILKKEIEYKLSNVV